MGGDQKADSFGWLVSCFLAPVAEEETRGFERQVVGKL